MLDKLKDLDLRYEDLESQLGDPRVYGDAEKLRQVKPGGIEGAAAGGGDLPGLSGGG